MLVSSLTLHVHITDTFHPDYAGTTLRIQSIFMTVTFTGHCLWHARVIPAACCGLQSFLTCVKRYKIQT